MSIRRISPSRWHDNAYKRDAGHDAMQAEFMDFLRTRPIAAKGFVHREVEAERPLRRDGEIVAYVDATEVVTVTFGTMANLFELKPRLYTVFGAVRQAKSLLELAEKDIPADQHHCHLVVKHDDPLLSELRKHWPLVWAWGVTFEAVA